MATPSPWTSLNGELWSPSAGTDLSSGSVWDMTYPTGILADDVLFLFGTEDAGVATDPVLGPGTWTKVYENDDTAYPHAWCYTQVCDGTETGAITATLSTVDMAAVLVQLRGVNLATPIEIGQLVTGNLVESPNSLSDSGTDWENRLALYTMHTEGATSWTVPSNTSLVAGTSLVVNDAAVASSVIGSDDTLPSAVWSASGFGLWVANALVIGGQGAPPIGNPINDAVSYWSADTTARSIFGVWFFLDENYLPGTHAAVLLNNGAVGLAGSQNPPGGILIPDRSTTSVTRTVTTGEASTISPSGGFTASVRCFIPDVSAGTNGIVRVGDGESRGFTIEVSSAGVLSGRVAGETAS